MIFYGKENFLSLKKNFLKWVSIIENSQELSILFVFMFFLISFVSVYMFLPVVSSGDDHYFHFRFAERFIQNGFLNSFQDFKTIYFTNVANGDHLLYYNFLFYLVLIPFTLINPLYLGIKLFAAISVSFIGTILYFFIKKMNIKYSFLWAIGFFSVIGLSSFWRLFLSRPFVLSPLIILLLIWAVYEKKYFWVFIFSFIILFWHTATFLLPLAVVILYFLCYFFYQKKYLWKEVFLVFLGTSLSVFVAFLIDQGFFISIRDNLFSVLGSVLDFSKNTIKIQEGMEVYPKNFFDLLNQNIFLCIMFIFTSIFYIFNLLKEIKQNVNFNDNVKNKKVVTMVFFVLSSLFIVAINFISNRFSDFFIFFGWIFVVFVLSELFSYIEFTKINVKKFFSYSVFVCLIYLFLNNSLQLNDMFASSGSRPETFSQVGRYISNNLKKGDVVFDVNWSWFSQLYYYAPEQNYVIGIEPKLTYLYSPRIFWLWQSIGYGYVCEEEKCEKKEEERDLSFRNKNLFKNWNKNEGDKIADIIKKDFKSNFIVSSNDFGYLNSLLNNNKHFEKVVNDSNNGLFLYKIID